VIPFSCAYFAADASTRGRTQDLAKKKELMDAIQRLAYEEVPYVLWGQWFLPSAYRTYVKGVLPFPAPLFWNVWLDKR